VSNLEGKPFALIGVNVVGHDARGLKTVMRKEKLTWRSFADPGEIGQGAIATRWNLTATPTLYLIDHKGVIRHKWIGGPSGKAIDAALEPLLKGAEKAGEVPPTRGR
jgi:hypothetical protein